MADTTRTTNTTNPPDPTYEIDGGTYRLEPLSWQQNKWLAEQIFCGIDMHRLDYAVVHDLLREKGPLFMSICLIDAGMTRAEHSRLAFRMINERAETFAASLTGEEVALFGVHFFRSCLGHLAQIAMLMPGQVLQRVYEQQVPPSPVPGESGSMAASSPSAEGISLSSVQSSPNGDRPSQSPISGGVSSETPWIAPSLAG